MHATLESLPAFLDSTVAPWVEHETVKRLGSQGQALPLTCCVTLGNKVPLWALVFLSVNMKELCQIIPQTRPFQGEHSEELCNGL